jgi:hypothetical protein
MLSSTKPFVLSLRPNGQTILIDECCSNLKFTIALLKAGFTVEFMGKKVQDSKIVSYLSKDENSMKILVTYDVELDSRLPYEQCILLNPCTSVTENIHMIKKVTESAIPRFALC